LRVFPAFQVLLSLSFKSKRPLARPDVFGRAECVMRRLVAFCRPGSDRLSRVLRRSTIGAGAFHGRVRNGNGCSHPAMTTRSAKRNFEKLVQFSTAFMCEHVLTSPSGARLCLAREMSIDQ
jgi:hypothetical protein